MQITKIDDITWKVDGKVDGKEIWYHAVKKVWFCWDCGQYDCAHVKELKAHLTKRAEIIAAGRTAQQKEVI